MRNVNPIASCLAFLFVVTGCSKATTPDPAPTSSAAATSSSAMPVVAPAVTASVSAPASAASAPSAKPAESGATGAKKVSRTAKILDTSDWKEAPAGSTLEVRWTVDQAKAKPPLGKGANADLTKHTVPIDLMLTLNGHSHAIALETNGAPPYSDSCSRVSFFYAGKNILFQLERADGGRAVLTRTETSESASTKAQQLYVFDVPAGSKLAQEIVTVDADGKRTSKTCSAAGLP